MPRKPANVLESNRQAAWEIMRKCSQFTLKTILLKVDVEKDTIREYVNGLVLAGFLEIIQEGKPPRTANVYRVINDVGREAPKVRADGTVLPAGSGRENMWRTMRILKQFTPRDLGVQASTEEHPIAESEAKDYVRFLYLAGYLALVRKSKPGTQAIYRFIPSKYTGPKPPMVQRVKQVFDQNTRKVVWTQEVNRDDLG